MDFLGVGPFELILILIVLFIVVGPAKLPEIAAMIGKGMRKFKEASAEMNRGLKDIAEEVKEAGDDIGKEVGRTAKPGTSLTKELREVSREIEGAVKEAGASVRSSPRSTRSAPKGTARSTTGASADKPKQTGTAGPVRKEPPETQSGEEEA